MSNIDERTGIAINRIKEFEPKDGYYLAFSGGKDSIVLYNLAVKSGVKFDAHFNFTTVDPPELIKFIKENYSKVVIDKPNKSMWQLIVKKHIPPTRLIRYCCEELKEKGGEGRTCLIGIRWQESNKRRKRKMVEFCYKKNNKKMIHPIIDWTTEEIWEYIEINNIKYCKLYDEGFKRIGCVLCPMAYYKQRWREVKRFPNFYNAYLLAFKKMLKNMPHSEKVRWKNEQEVADWWLEKNRYPEQAKAFFDANQ